MPEFSQNSIPRDKFLLICINLLHRHFIGCGRTQAKRHYQDIRDGQIADVTTVKMEDDSNVVFKLSLDHSEFMGHFNFSAFRDGLSVLLSNISAALQDKREVQVFTIGNRPGALLFGITGVTVEDGKACVMVLGADTDVEVGTVRMRLMYLDPEQFDAQGDAVGASADAQGTG